MVLGHVLSTNHRWQYGFDLFLGHEYSFMILDTPTELEGTVMEVENDTEYSVVTV